MSLSLIFVSVCYDGIIVSRGDDVAFIAYKDIKKKTGELIDFLEGVRCLSA